MHVCVAKERIQVKYSTSELHTQPPFKAKQNFETGSHEMVKSSLNLFCDQSGGLGLLVILFSLLSSWYCRSAQ